MSEEKNKCSCSCCCNCSKENIAQFLKHMAEFFEKLK